MILKSCTEAGTNRRKLEIEVDAATLEKGCQKAYHKTH